MTEFEKALFKLRLSESSVIKLLKAFNVEYSDNGLIIYTPTQPEQEIAVALVKQLQKSNEIAISADSILVPVTDKMKAKLRHDYQWNIEECSMHAIEMIAKVYAAGASIQYRLPGMSGQPMLQIRAINSPERTQDLRKHLQYAGVSFADYDKPDTNTFGDNQIVLYGKDAKRIATILAEKNINFEGRRFFPPNREK